MDKDKFIEIPKDLYNTLLDNFNNVINVYKENGELRGKIIALETEKRFLIEYNQTQQIPKKNQDFNDFEQDLTNTSENLHSKDNSYKDDSYEEVIYSTKKDDEKLESKIKNSSRVVGFWIFIFSLGSIVGNFWLQGFEMLVRDVYINLGIFLPFLFGGIASILNPKLPGTIGWLISFLASSFFVLNYFGILNNF